ncbi:protein TONSOKU-like isoform X2 [Chenopodium quinoa]|uniref:protein TONSOKU-like isoform X2 n=1 Tax=Chenopodium quinoa TaxID=63459 RepID=UPI000B783A19|nr:protein TONSOKU-like isoform X2 [Chenopodium quinoa]
MGKNDPELSSARKAYRSAKGIGNRKEEARWANVIGDLHKNRGEYCEALNWLRIDYEISSAFLLQKDRLPSCQSMGELYLRLHDFANALRYQKEHLELAKDEEDLVEQQRANTQLGRTYQEMFTKYEDHSALHKAKKFFKSSMILAKTLKENPPDSKSSFLKEYIDAYNNVGMLEMELDNLEEAEKILTKGLEICDEEEVNENDEGRTRLHHNLGFVYMQLRKWNKAREHIRKDIMICKNIGHRQGESKGYINLGELFCKVQKFDQTLRCYQMALKLAKSLEDEFALARQIEENIRIVKEYIKVMEDIKTEEQNFKKLRRSLNTAKGTSSERKCLRQLMKSLDLLIDKATVVSAWEKHREFAKKKKKIASELSDKEKLADSYLVVGESYEKLRNFQKARKWYTKSWGIYKVIGNLEGQAIVKINLGDVLDSEGDWQGALMEFQEGHRIAAQAKKIPTQISALENMHYSHMIRFDNVDEARKLKLEIESLQALLNSEQEPPNALENSCSETETEGNDSLSEDRFVDCGSSHGSEPLPVGKSISSLEDLEDDEVLSSLSRCKKLQKLETSNDNGAKRVSGTAEASPKNLPDSLRSPLTTIGRKRARLVISDDEEDAQCSNRSLDATQEDIATSNELKSRSNHLDSARDQQDTSSCNLVNHEESSCSYKSSKPEEAAHGNLKSLADNKYGIRIKFEDASVCIEAEPSVFAGEFDIEALKLQAACSYYLQLSSQRRSSGLLPIIDNLKFGEQILATDHTMDTLLIEAQAGGSIEASINGWVQKRLIKMYVDCCQRLAEPPNMKLLMKLYNLKISEDEVIVSDCELQDMSVVPLLDALSAHKTISMLNLSHNMLGNATMERLKQALTSSGQKYGALVLDLHCNLFGPTALFQICECPVLFSRLEVLNISGNRLTDACGTYLSTILNNCKGLYSLNMERCSITSRTIQTVSDALDSGSVLSQLLVGHNNPISGNSLSNLLGKLAKLERFSELSLDGIKLNKHASDSVCQLARSSCLSGLMLGATNIGSDGALKLTESLFHETQELAKLNLSYCGLRLNFVERLKIVPAVLNILELNLAGNPITSEAGNALASILANSECSLKLLLLNKCHLGLTGVIKIMNSLAENESLEELNLAGNIEQEQLQHIGNDITGNKNSETLGSKKIFQDPAGEQHEEDTFNQLVVADSYEYDSRAEDSDALLADTCNSQDNQRIKELSAAISNAKHLELLDLSNNGFTTQVADTFYTAWCSSTRAGVPRRHVNDQLLHLSTQDKICCGLKPCC